MCIRDRSEFWPNLSNTHRRPNHEWLVIGVASSQLICQILMTKLADFSVNFSLFPYPPIPLSPFLVHLLKFETALPLEKGGSHVPGSFGSPP